MFEATGKMWQVRDPETGISITVRTTPEIEELDAVIEAPDARVCNFAFSVKPRFSERSFRIDDPDNPTLKLGLGGLMRVALFRNGTREENTAFVHYILSGLSKINQLSPLSRNPFFYTDRYLYEGRDVDFHFDVPNESEILKL